MSYFYHSWGHGIAYRPLMRVSFFIDNQLFGENPLGWHLHSYILHSLNAALLFLLVYRLNNKYLLAVIIALLFTIAPWGHDNIAWISARTYLLSSFFYLAAMYLILLYLLDKKISLLFFSSVLLIFSLITYEASVTFTPVVGLILFFYRTKLQLSSKHLFYLVLYFSLITLVFLIFRYILLKGIGSVDPNHDHYLYGLYDNLQAITKILFYDYPVISICALISFLLFVIIQWYQHNLKKTLFSCIIILSLAFVIYLPFSQIKGVAYRFLYLMQVPYIYSVCYVIYELIRFEKLHREKLIFSYILLLSFLTGTLYSSVEISKEWQVAGRWSKYIPAQVQTS